MAIIPETAAGICEPQNRQGVWQRFQNLSEPHFAISEDQGGTKALLHWAIMLRA